MKQLECPLNGVRNIDEFHYGGLVRTMPDPVGASDEEWADYLFLDDNVRGVVREWWLHVPSGYWFVAERDTATDRVLRTFKAADLFTARVDYGTDSP